MSKPRVGLVYPLDDDVAMDLLHECAEVVVATGDDDAAISRLLSEVEGIVMRSPARITREQIEGSAGLRVIAGLGSGTDTVDSVAATERGIPVINSAGVSPETIAEYVIGAMTFGRRGLFRANRALVDTKDFDWESRGELRGREVRGSTLGLVGYGHIGRAAARMAIAAFDVRVLAYDPFVEIGDPGVEQLADLDELLRVSDVVSIHTPLLPATRTLIGARQLELIGPAGVFISAARGGVVDQEALIAALESGALGAAVIDVYDGEPPSSEVIARLSAVPTAFLTPHLGGQTHEAHHARERHVIRELAVALGGGRPATVANPAVFGARPEKGSVRT